jgi:hypothetical protein
MPLACGGSEIVEGLAKEGQLPSISTHILQTVPGIDVGKLKRLRNQHWNALKHFYAQDGKTVRDDEALMADFNDQANDAVLFCGWLDYRDGTQIELRPWFGRKLSLRLCSGNCTWGKLSTPKQRAAAGAAC